MEVEPETLRLALKVADDACECAMELLSIHDTNLGRTTEKNAREAQELERIIREAVQVRQLLMDILVFKRAESLVFKRADVME